MTSRRFESISGILNRSTTDHTQADEPHDEQDATVETAPVPPPTPASVTELRAPTPKGRRVPAQPGAKASARAAGGVRRIAFRLDPTVHAALAAAATRANTSHGQIVLDAIEAAHRSGTLSDLVAHEVAGPRTDSLFPRLKGRGTAQPTVPVEIRLHAQSVTVLDSLVTQTSADSRTQLIVAALRRHLN